MLSCAVHDHDQPQHFKACVSRDKGVSIVHLDVGRQDMSSSCYLSVAAARKLFRAGLTMCDEIEKETSRKSDPA